MIQDILKYRPLQILLLIALVAFFPLLGVLHLFDWDEINFAESAREMIVSGDYFTVSVNFEPFWEKPPLFFWLQALSMKVFGINEYAARFPNALAGIATLIVLFWMGKRERDERFGVIMGFLYLGSLLPHFYFRSGIIDPLFNLFIFLSSYFIYLILAGKEHKRGRPFLAGLFTGLAILTKGPVGLLLVLLTFLVFIVVKRFKVLPSGKSLISYALTVLIVSGIWFVPDMIRNGAWFLVEFISYQIDLFLNPVAGHGQPFWYHFVVVFFGTFPISIFALPVILKGRKQEGLTLWMLVLFWVVILLFSMVETKIVHYSSMTYLPLVFLAAEVVYRAPKWNDLPRLSRSLYWSLAVLFSFIYIALPLVAIFKDSIMHLIKDPFAVASFSNDAVKWTGWESLIGPIALVGFILLVRFWKGGQFLRGMMVQSLCFSLMLGFMVFFVVRKIEMYTQGPLITFLESIKDEDVYISPSGMKSYAHYFYGEITPEESTIKTFREKTGRTDKGQQFEADLRHWLARGDIDKPVYYFCRINHQGLKEIDGIEHLYDAGGFSFYKREPSD